MNDRIDEPPSDRKQALDELRGIHRELVALRRLLDTAIGTFLNAKFPYGIAADRWKRPRG